MERIDTTYMFTTETSQTQNQTSLKELEYLSVLFFEGKHESLDQLNSAKLILEEVYLPDNPSKHCITRLLSFFNETSSLVLKLVISERLSYYVEQR